MKTKEKPPLTAAMLHHAEEAAQRYMDLAWPGFKYHVGPTMPRQVDQAADLVRAAFVLYAISWDNYDVRKWDWPFFGLDPGQRIEYIGQEPWTVLFRQVMALFDTAR